MCNPPVMAMGLEISGKSILDDAKDAALLDVSDDITISINGSP